MKPQRRTRNAEALALLGQRLRHARESAGLSQAKVPHMRQGTVSKIENGSDVTLDTFLTYATSLGLEIGLLPIGQTGAISSLNPSEASHRAVATDLLTEFAHLQDLP